MSDKITWDMLIEQANKLAEPIDFEYLQRAGVLRKEGAWYRVLNFAALPEHARTQVTGMKNMEKGIAVKFTSERKRKGAANLVKQLEKYKKQSRA